MNLEQLRIAIRPRRDWEAVDLGLRMAQQWWWQMLRVWLIITSPWLIAACVMPPEHQWLVSVSLWWCKPLFERPLLMILSQGVFGVKLTTREVLRATPRLFLNQVFLSLTWRRFSFTRSMDLPVIQLEGLHGAERRDRLNVLHRIDSGPASWLTIIGVHVESFLMLACVALLGILIPEEVGAELWSWGFWGESRAGGALLILFAYIAMAVVGPLFVACGFSLYLNRRVKLEGWDIEIAFKRMAQKRGLPTVAMLAFVALLQLMPLAAPPANAQSEREAVKEEILAIKQGPDFHRKETQRVIKTDQTEDEIDFDKGFWRALIEFLTGAGSLAAAVASVAELLLWALVLLAIVLLILKYGSWLERFPQLMPRRRRREYRPQTLFGMEVTKESLPDDVSSAALALWQNGEQRPALALLYRASLTSLLNVGVALREGSTELECLRLAERQQQELGIPSTSIIYLAELTRVWGRLAYGHQAPSDAEATALCRDWGRHWPEVTRG